MPDVDGVMTRSATIMARRDVPERARERAMRLLSELSDFDIPLPDLVDDTPGKVILAREGRVRFSFSFGKDIGGYVHGHGTTFTVQADIGACVMPLVGPLRVWKEDGKL